MARQVPVGKSTYALVDDEDYALVSRYKWCVSVRGYAVCSYWDKGTYGSLLMHRLILGLGPGDPGVDHANHDGLDNRRENLRLATGSQNQANARKQRRGTSSKYKGVCWKRREQRWYTQINSVRGKHISLGHFDAEIDAARAYDAAAAYFYGEFACLNFPDEIPAPYLARRKLTGVYYYPTYPGHKKWRAQYQCNGKYHYVGVFLTEQDAVVALQSYKREHNL